MNLEATLVSMFISLVLAFYVVAFHGQHLARLRWDRYYRRAAVRSEKLRLDIEFMASQRRIAQRQEKAQRKAEHTTAYRDLNNWNHQFNALLAETKERK